MAAPKKKSETEIAKALLSYKGFDKNFKCRDFQFKVGETYTHAGSVKACEGGFHACEYPLDVFNYYPPGTSQFATVEQVGEISRHDGDSKIASSVLTVKATIDIASMVKAAIDFTHERITKKAKENSKDKGVVVSSGSNGASSNSGYQGASSNSGDYGASSNSGDYGASSNSGVRGASFANGLSVKVTTESENSIAVAVGRDGRGKAADGTWLVLVYRDEDWVIEHVKSALSGKDIKSDTWYKLNARGKFVVAKDE